MVDMADMGELDSSLLKYAMKLIPATLHGKESVDMAAGVAGKDELASWLNAHAAYTITRAHFDKGEEGFRSYCHLMSELLAPFVHFKLEKDHHFSVFSADVVLMAIASAMEKRRMEVAAGDRSRESTTKVIEETISLAVMTCAIIIAVAPVCLGAHDSLDAVTTFGNDKFRPIHEFIARGVSKIVDQLVTNHGEMNGPYMEFLSELGVQK